MCLDLSFFLHICGMFGVYVVLVFFFDCICYRCEVKQRCQAAVITNGSSTQACSSFLSYFISVSIETLPGHFCGGEYEGESGGRRKGVLC